ncbi:MAG: Gfo/Idh/MocA family oxidoreductase [Bryobacteraceae bacterium]
MITRRSLLLSPAVAMAPPAVKLPRKVRVGIIGFEGHAGEITGQLHRLPDVEVTAVCSAEAADLARAKKNPRLATAREYSSYRQMLEREQLDVAAITNGNGERAEAILACTLRKLNVIAEKPLAIHRNDYEAVRKAVEQSGIKFGMLLPMRFESPYLALKKIVDEGLVGEILQIGSQKSYKSGERASWYLKSKTYGSTILWIGIHMIDLMRWTSGREFVAAVSLANHIAFPQLGEMDNVTASLFSLDNGGIATLRMDYLRTAPAETHGDDRLRLAGTRGIAEYQAATGVTLMTADRKPALVPELPPQGSVFVDYLESVYLGKKTRLPLQDIWRVNEITLAAHEAATKKGFVKT